MGRTEDDRHKGSATISIDEVEFFRVDVVTILDNEACYGGKADDLARTDGLEACNLSVDVALVAANSGEDLLPCLSIRLVNGEVAGVGSAIVAGQTESLAAAEVAHGDCAVELANGDW